jgi:hypothetical protein
VKNSSAVTQKPSYTWNDTHGLVDVISMPPEFTQFNQMVLASGNSFQSPFMSYNVMRQTIGGSGATGAMTYSLDGAYRFSLATMCLNMIIAWIIYDDSETNRYYDEVTRRSARYNRVLPGSWQLTVSGALYPSFPTLRKYSWPVFMGSICKLHDATHEFHGGLVDYDTWCNRFGVMAYRFNVPDEDNRSFYSGLSTQNVSLQGFLTMTNPTAEDIGTAGGTSPIPAITANNSLYIAMQTTSVLNIGPNKTTNLII